MIALPCYAGQLQRWTIRRRPCPTPQQGQTALKRCRHPQQRRVQSSSETFQQTISDDDEPDHDNYMQEYKQLKDKLLDNTRKSGSAIGLYFLLLVNGQAAACCMLGTAFSYGYMWLLCQDVDSVKGTDMVPYWEADKIENAWLRRGAKVAAAYQQALRPRLLVPVAMAALLGAINLVSEEPLPLVYQGCALGGFLSYKLALLLETFQQNSLKARSAGDDDRPVLEKLDDELDMYGRPKKPLTSPAVVLPEEQQLKVAQQLAEEEAKQQRKQAR